MREEVEEYLEPEPVCLESLLAYDGEDDKIPPGVMTRTLYLDARASNPLIWKDEIAQIEALIQSGYSLLFDLDLGNFLQKQIQTQALALDTFYETIYSRYSDQTVGVILHRSESILSKEQQQVLEELRSYLPTSLHCILCFDCKAIQDPLAFARLFSLDRFTRFVLALKDAPVALNTCIWEQGKGRLGYIGKTLPKAIEESPKLGILIPRSEVDDEAAYDGLNEAMQTLLSKNIPFKVISEELLPLEWDGLDELIVQKQALAQTTLRTLDGFAAAGGKVINLDSAVGNGQ
jgi:hypothetical protein